MTRSEAWVRFAASAMTAQSVQPIPWCAKEADELLAEYDKRFDENGVERYPPYRPDQK